MFRIFGNKPTTGQIRKIVKIVKSSIKLSGLDQDGISKIINCSKEFQVHLTAVLKNLGEKRRGLYSSTSIPISKLELLQNWPPGWAVPPIEEQKVRLKRIFSNINLDYTRNLLDSVVYPDNNNAHGIIIVPKIKYLGEKMAGLKDPYGNDYGRVVDYVLNLLCDSKQHKFHKTTDNCKGLYLYEKVKEVLPAIEQKIPGDVIVMPVNFGTLYEGGYVGQISKLNIRFSGDYLQLPLGAAYVGYLFLSLREWLEVWEKDNLVMSCPSDIFSQGTDKGSQMFCSAFFYNMGVLSFGNYWTGALFDFSDSPVGLLPKDLLG